jgi:DegV family protein with EDD domain
MVKIITDTTSCLSLEVAQKYDISIIPQVITFGEESYLEGQDMDITTFMKRLRSSRELPKTAAPPHDLFIKEFLQVVPSGEPILCIHPSIEVSGTVRSAEVAKREFPGADIRIIDTRTVASPLGTMVELAAQWVEKGDTADAIESSLNKYIKRCKVYFLVTTLEYLIKGGRIGGASALIGSVLQIRPILTIQDGRVNVYEKERTDRRALSRLKEIVVNQIPHDGTGLLSVMHAGVPEEGHALADDLSKLINQPNIPVVNVPPAITTHGGPGILGVGFFIA